MQNEIARHETSGDLETMGNDAMIGLLLLLSVCYERKGYVPTSRATLRGLYEIDSRSCCATRGFLPHGKAETPEAEGH